jgi:hypothetical protein
MKKAIINILKKHVKTIDKKKKPISFISAKRINAIADEIQKYIDDNYDYREDAVVLSIREMRNGY